MSRLCHKLINTELIVKNCKPHDWQRCEENVIKLEYPLIVAGLARK